jgi:hypothetical protein
MHLERLNERDGHVADVSSLRIADASRFEFALRLFDQGRSAPPPALGNDSLRPEGP